MTVRVGVVGAGNMGADHVRNLAGQISRSQVSWIADVDAERAESVASTVPGARATSDPQQLIEQADVDAVVIASHDDTHARLVMACQQAGKPVLCEKPLAPSVEDVRAIAGAPGADLVSVGFMRRFDPGYAELRASLRSGSLGAPLVVHCASRNTVSYPGGDSATTITNSAIHELDILPWLLGSPVAEVSWHAPRRSSRAGGERHDPQLMLLRMADGVLVTLEVFLNATYGYSVQCEVVCEDGVVSLCEPALTVTDADRRHSRMHPYDWRPRFAEAYRLELQAWVDALDLGAPSPLASAAESVTAALVAQALIDAIDAGGAWVPVSAG